MVQIENSKNKVDITVDGIRFYSGVNPDQKVWAALLRFLGHDVKEKIEC